MSKSRGRRLLPLRAEQAAYIAGVIDGEGMITISRKKDPTMRRGYCFRPHVSVSNTNKLLLFWLQQTAGVGAIQRGSRATLNRKQGWRWELWSNTAGQLLEATLPYLVIKTRQAELLLAFIRAKRDGVGRDGLTATEWAFQEETCRSLRLLNKRGRDVAG